MGKFVDLTGQRFGKWTVLLQAENNGNGKVRWKCRCDCGTEKVVLSHNLTQGLTQSCGCSKHKPKRKDMTGKRFGRLTAIKEVEPLITLNGQKKVRWLCKCDCGNETIVYGSHLRNGNTMSCGCKAKENRIALITNNTTHGLTHTKLYSVWCWMIKVCYNPNAEKYSYYGGRGITVCDKWKDDFKAFYDWAMANGYKEEIMENGYNYWTIERIDNDGNFEPDNCCWADRVVQMNNTRRNKRISYKTKSFTVAEAARKYKIPANTLRNRLKSKYSVQNAIETPVQRRNGRKNYDINVISDNGKTETLTLIQAARKFGISRNTLSNRLKRSGWDLEKALIAPIKKAQLFEYKGQKHTLKEFSDIHKISYITLCGRLQRGMAIAEAIETPVKKRLNKKVNLINDAQN